MKKIIVLILAIVIAMIFACSKSVVIDMPPTRSIGDTTNYTPRSKADTTEREDTARVPISFTVTVEDWKEIVVN